MRALMTLITSLGFVVLILLAGFSVEIDKSKPHHPLFQISKGEKDLTSVDENKDGIIDHTNADIEEILSNGNRATRDLILDSTLRANNAIITTSNIQTATVESLTSTTATINTAEITTGTISNLRVLSNIDASSINAGSISSSSMRIGDLLEVRGTSTHNNLRATSMYADSLCMRLSDTNSEVVCINNWEDLLEVLFVRLG